jgi:hypothetical protein
MRERRGIEHGSGEAREGDTGPAPQMAHVRVQRQCACGATVAGPGGACGECDRKRVARKAAGPELDAEAPDVRTPDALLAGLGAGEPFGGAARDRMERSLGHDFRSIRIHADAAGANAAHALGAHGFAIGDHVGFAAGRYNPGTPGGDALLAHELAHTLQQGGGAAGPGVADEVLESDADRAAFDAMASLYGGADAAAAPTQRTAGSRLSLSRCARRTEPEHALTHDEAMVARARRMLPIVRRYIAEFHARRQMHDILLMRRRQIEDPLAAATRRPELETANLRALNRAPLRVELAEGVVRFHARFQVRFEDPAHAARLGAIRGAVQRAADTVWTSPEGESMYGRRFEMQTTVEAESGTRDPDFWLIVVRAGDLDPVTHPGCALPDPRPVVAAVTDSNCDGGVMNLPPRGMTDASLIGHEMLHLFGLVDRYLMTTAMPPPTTTPLPSGSPPRPPPTPTTSTTAMRETGGRPDPLGSERGPILAEDLAFIYDNLGIFESDEADFARRIGMDLGRAMRFEAWCEETIRLGRDASSLIRPREDFRDRMFRNAEDL